MPAETVREKALLEKPRLTREQIAGRAALRYALAGLLGVAKMESWEWDAARNQARKTMTSWTP